MGVDAGIFAKNAKKYYWFDRARNLQGWRYVDDFWDKYSEECERADIIHENMYQPDHWNTHVSAKDALFLASLSREAYLGSDDEDRHFWSEQVIKFINLFPNDVFSIKSDHGGEWPECTDTHDQIHDFDLPCKHEWHPNGFQVFEQCVKCRAIREHKGTSYADCPACSGTGNIHKNCILR